MKIFMTATFAASLAMGAGVHAQNTESTTPDFAVNANDAASITAFNSARLPDFQSTASEGDIYGYTSTVLFYYVGGLEQAGGSLIAIDRICDPQPETPGRGVCDWQYRYASLQAPLTDPATAHPPDQLEIFTARPSDCPAIADLLAEFRIGPDPAPYDVWMGSTPQADLYDRQYRRLEIVIGPAYAPAADILVEGSRNPWLRNIAVQLQSPLRACREDGE
ncbi:MAG: hypothetical protein GC188_07755 [Alphaproteobacteria bacterium]|nr:hypothetical protein [Alphaproteobacteria bacterium]